MKTKLTLLLLVLGFLLGKQTQACQASFTTTSSPGSNVITFQSNSTGLFSSMSWNFGDGTSGQGSTVTHTYNAIGYYSVCLTVWDSTGGGCQSTYCDSVYSGSNGTTCNATFTFASAGTNAFSFDPAMTGSQLYFNWDFNDGSTSTLENPVHTFPLAGTYSVCLWVTDSIQMCADYQCMTITVGNPAACDASFAVADSGTLAVFTSTNNTPNQSTYQWSFGDGTSSQSYNPTHNYPQPGTYYACLTVTDAFLGCTSTWCDTVIIGGNPTCQASFGYQQTGLTVNFTGSNPASNITSWSWTFGDNSVGTGANPQHQYANAGTYLVCLTITTSNGCSSTACRYVTVSNPPPPTCNAQFMAIDSSGYFYFMPTSYNSSLNYYWTFGDGSTSTSPYAIHQYSGGNTWVVCLTVTNPGTTCNAQYCDTVTSNPNGGNCQASFTATTDTSTNVATFVNTSTGNFTSAIWSFGDGTSGSGTAFSSHQYATSGVYTVCLTIYNNSPNGCQSSYCDSISVGSGQGNLCIPQFYTYPDSTIGNGVTYFGILNSCPGTQYVWYTGNTTIGSGLNPVYQFPDSGWYVVCVDAITSNGTFTTCDSVYALRIGGATGIVENENTISLSAYPNPVTDLLNIQFNLSQSEIVVMDLLSLDGRSIVRNEEKLNAGIQIESINTRDIPSGMYIIRLDAGGHQAISRIVVLH